MIKKLTIALLLFATGTLFAQITAPVPTTFLVVDATGNVVGELLIDPLVLPGALTVTGVLTAKDSVWIGTFEGSTFRDLNIKQTNVSKAIRIEERTGTEAYEIGIGTDGTFALYDDDGSLSFYIADGTNLVVVEDSIWVKKTSRFGGNAKFESDVLVEGDLDVQGQFTSTFALDLPYYSKRNTINLWGVDVYPLIGNYSAGEHGDSTVNFLTDEQSIGVYVPASGTNDGITFPLPDTNWTKSTDGGTIELADWYFLVSIRLDSVSQARLPENGLRFSPGSFGNSYKTDVAKASFSEDWNHIKVALSAFAVSAGSPSWANCDSLWMFTVGESSGDGPLIFLVENIQLVRGINGGPNPFQSETANGTWVADWTQEGDGNVWLVEESGQLGVFAGDATSYPASVTAFNEFSASGVIDPGATDRAYFLRGGTTSMRFRAWDQTLNIRGMNDQTYVSVPFTEFASGGGGRLWWKLTRSAGVVVGKASVDGISWVTVRDSTDGGEELFNFYPGATNRIRSFGLSAVEYAAEAGVAQRLQGIHFHRGAEGLEITIGDSTYFMVIDSIQ